MISSLKYKAWNFFGRAVYVFIHKQQKKIYNAVVEMKLSFLLKLRHVMVIIG